MELRLSAAAPSHDAIRAAARGVLVEEPMADAVVPRMDVTIEDGVRVAVRTSHRRSTHVSSVEVQRALLDACWRHIVVASHALWYYTPMALAFSRHLAPAAVLFDCMDELAAFAGARPSCRAGGELLLRADVVTTGGQSLYEAKRACTGTSTCFQQRRRRALRARPDGAGGIRTDAAAAPAPGLFRRHRRAHGLRARRGHRRRATTGSW